MGYCNGCFEKQLEIDLLKERIEHLEHKITYRKRKEKEGYFGSQYVAGAKARSILITILHTARKRLPTGSLEEWFKNSLDQIAQDPSIETYSFMPKPTRDSS